MPDAGPSTSAKGKAPVGKAAKVGADAGTDGKKRFEVKKVRPDSVQFHGTHLSLVVERSSSLGMGYRRGQLRHLPEPHHGSV